MGKVESEEESLRECDGQRGARNETVGEHHREELARLSQLARRTEREGWGEKRGNRKTKSQGEREGEGKERPQMAPSSPPTAAWTFISDT